MTGSGAHAVREYDVQGGEGDLGRVTRKRAYVGTVAWVASSVYMVVGKAGGPPIIQG